MRVMAEPVIQSAVPLAPLTSLRVGGLARWFAVASSIDDVAAAQAGSRSRGVPLMVLGGCTNVVVADAGLEALVVSVQPRGLVIDEDGGSLTITAGQGNRGATSSGEPAAPAPPGLE